MGSGFFFFFRWKWMEIEIGLMGVQNAMNFYWSAGGAAG